MAGERVLIHGFEELQERLAQIERHGGDIGQVTLVIAQAVSRDARGRARAKGGRSYWRDVARQVHPERVGADGAGIFVPYSAAGRDKPRTIRPKNARALTIPVSDEARGKRAREFEQGGRDLFTLDIEGDPDTKGLLGYAEDDGDFHALFVLRTRVDQDADPWFTPPVRQQRIAADELDRFAGRMMGAQR